ncbi:hypothetical protein DM43_4712 [Burkholderia cepacia]|uniref:Uncharacterized protein n=1 Tax=Burkholderia cepacia TaxID=292 RepID=A0AA88ZAK0_BURCE|nr:hypothetical protein DM43_4712 [Burkholderia cepacia]
MLNTGCRPETDYRDTFLPPKLNQIDSIFQAVSPVGDVAEVSFQMAHGSTITALEAYLADTMKFWFNRYPVQTNVLKESPVSRVIRYRR